MLGATKEFRSVMAALSRAETGASIDGSIGGGGDGTAVDDEEILYAA